MGKVLIVGLDGATWSLFGPWARAGRMPTLAALMASGSWGTLRSTIPPLTLPAWSSMMTGRNPGAHGIFAFRRMVPGDYHTGGLASAADLGARTLWDVAGAAGKQVGVINVPPSYPIRPINGFVVSCMLTPPGEAFTYPPELANEIGEYVIDLPAPRGLRRDDVDYLARGLPYLEGLLRQTQLRTRATIALMRRPWDLLCVVYYSPDRIQHYFWPDLVGTTAGGEPRVHAALEAAFAALDESLGRLVAAAGPETTVVLVSDHGFAAKPTYAIHLNRWLSQGGFLRERPFWRLRRRIVRKLVAAKSRPRYDTVERMVDMTRSRAWAQTLEPGTAGVWINVKGRYPLGYVADGPEYEATRKEIVEGMRGLRTDDGRPVFDGVWRREELYRGPYVTNAPDIIAACAPYVGVLYESVRRDLRSRALFGPFAEMGFTGSHHGEGLYLFSGPEIRSLGPHQEYPIESIAPTALHLLGVAVPRAMEGPVCESLLTNEFLLEHPVMYQDDEEDALAPQAGWKSAADEERIAEHLRALGYVE